MNHQNEEQLYKRVQKPHRVSAVAQWRRICLPMQKAWVWSLVWELRSHMLQAMVKILKINKQIQCSTYYSCLHYTDEEPGVERGQVTSQNHTEPKFWPMSVCQTGEGMCLTILPDIASSQYSSDAQASLNYPKEIKICMVTFM